MKYHIYWRPAHEQLLQNEYFMDYETGRDSVWLVRKYQEVMRLLQTPHDVGESREDPERLLTVMPLTITYEVFEAERVVMIHELRIDRREKFRK